jgi:hypothetical protein
MLCVNLTKIVDMKKSILIFAIALGACTSETNDIVETTHEHAVSEEVVLDNGKKWAVDTEMMIHIQNINSDVSSFEGKEFDVLHEKLDNNLTLLTSNCTMSGQAHDELHKWLVPFLGTVQEFGNASTMSESQQIFREIESAMVEFKKYFE